MVFSRHKGHMAHRLYHFYILTWKLGCVSLAPRIAKLSIKCWKTLPVFCICVKTESPKAVLSNKGFHEINNQTFDFKPNFSNTHIKQRIQSNTSEKFNP
jgi:hypothetical protein